MSGERQPVVEDGIKYWASRPANDDGVLGGYGTGSLPRVESLGSRQFLLHLLPFLSTVPSAIRPLRPPARTRRSRALDVGAGVGRVTADTLLPLISDVVLLEPVESLVQVALSRGKESTNAEPSSKNGVRKWKGISDGSRSVTFYQGTLQAFDPANPVGTAKFLGRVGYALPDGADEGGFDVLWCQWCLMYMTDPDLVAFLRRSRSSLRDAQSVIVVKENVCSDKDEHTEAVEFDEEDSSVTRSDLAWKRVFREAGLSLVHQQVQNGLPPGLFMVKMYALR
ncbi:DUF858-domain-containing protein [Auriscalpium vulgare]|uniref:DUF858-domain-containing protein n=1 Tax=Auriscalpium vulgare TaxID=40419 RepID=A0ACB8SBZ9_9AGAM|nr:DUF858-domain-containing protein [Auriscalpium vulgare]